VKGSLGGEELQNATLPYLVTKSQLGDYAAVEQLLLLFGPMAYSVIRNLLYPSADIDNVYQEACIYAFKNIGSLREPDKFGGWFKRIAVGKAIDCLRRRSSAPISCALNPEINTYDAAAFDVAALVEAHMVQQAVADLPEHYRVVIILYYWCDYSYLEIAENLSIPQGTVMSRLHTAKQLLAEKLGEEVVQYGY